LTERGPSATELAGLFQDHRAGLAGAVRGVLGPRADVEEVLQDAYLKALSAIQRGSSPRDPVAWMFVITLNLCRDLRRRQARRGPEVDLEEVNPMELKSTVAEATWQAEGGEALAAAKAAVAQLGDPQKDVFLLKVSGGLTFEAIGEALGIPTGTAKTRMRAALLTLRKSLAPFDITSSRTGRETT